MIKEMLIFHGRLLQFSSKPWKLQSLAQQTFPCLCYMVHYTSVECHTQYQIRIVNHSQLVQVSY